MDFFKIILIVIMGLCSQVVQAAQSEALSLYVENDSRNIGGPGSDNAYSSGLKFSYIFAESGMRPWVKNYFGSIFDWPWRSDEALANYGLSLGSQIYTPNNTQTNEFIADDRPYASWLYLGFSAHFQEPKISHAYELDLGVIGPEAQGEHLQNQFHRAIDVPSAKGWDHQLKTEPTVQLSYQNRRRILEVNVKEDKYFDVIPMYGAALGNVLINAHLGGLVRFGRLPSNEFGPARPSMVNGDSFISPNSSVRKSTYFYVFAAGQGIAVARNIFLDGSTFRSSHHVTKYPFLLETEFGFVGTYKNVNATWRFVTRSPEFEQKSVVNSFASLSISVAY